MKTQDTLLDSTASDALDWLRGQSAPGVRGARVLLSTYGNVGYFGAFEERDFVRRYEPRGGSFVASPLDRLSSAAAEEWSKQVGAAIVELQAAGRIVQLPTPRQYDGAAVLYGLSSLPR